MAHEFMTRMGNKCVLKNDLQGEDMEVEEVRQRLGLDFIQDGSVAGGLGCFQTNLYGVAS